jgi:hypothetical protein
MGSSRLVLALVLAAAGCGEELRVRFGVTIHVTSEDLAETTVDATALAGVMGLDVSLVVDGNELPMAELTGGRYTLAQTRGFPGALVGFVDGEGLALPRSDPFAMTVTPLAGAFQLVIDPAVDPDEDVSIVMTTVGMTVLPIIELAAGDATAELPGDVAAVDVRRERTARGPFEGITTVVKSLVVTR